MVGTFSKGIVLDYTFQPRMVVGHGAVDAIGSSGEAKADASGHDVGGVRQSGFFRGWNDRPWNANMWRGKCHGSAHSDLCAERVALEGLVVRMIASKGDSFGTSADIGGEAHDEAALFNCT